MSIAHEDFIDPAMWDGIGKINKDLLAATEFMVPDEARHLSDFFYTIQDMRIAKAAQIRAQKAADEPHETLVWFFDQLKVFENQAGKALTKFAETSQAGRWAMSQKGVAGVISAGLLAHIRIDKNDPKHSATSPGKLFQYGGVNPEATWEKGQKRPWNAKLKTLVCYKLGECLVKVQNHEDAFYGHLYRDRKLIELRRNDSGQYSAQAAHDAQVEKKLRTGARQTGLYGADTDAWKWVNGCFTAGVCMALQDHSAMPLHIQEDAKAKTQWLKEHRARVLEEAWVGPGNGQPMLPPSQIHGRARRHAAKIFLVHFWEEMWVEKYNEEPPIPWIFTDHDGAGHSDRIYRPNPTPLKSAEEWEDEQIRRRKLGTARSARMAELKAAAETPAKKKASKKKAAKKKAAKKKGKKK